MDSLSNSQLLDQLLESNLGDKPAGVVVRKDNYRDLVSYGNVTSYSMQQVLRSCARKFQIMKLSASLDSEYGEDEREVNANFAFGHAVGAGVAVIDAGGTEREAIWQAFLAWNIDLLEEAARKPMRPDPKKSFFYAVWAIKTYVVFREEETDLSEYDVVKNEATIAVDFEDGHFYVGHIDSLLQHRETGRFKVKENKTTVFSTIDPAAYANSDQSLSYSLVVDQLGESEYDVIYTIYSSTEQRWISFEFTKSALDKAEWLQSQFFLHADIEMYSEHGLFPRNGASCLNFGRRCEHYENCSFNMERVYGRKFSDLKQLKSIEELEQVEHIDYAFTLTDIRNQMKKSLTHSITTQLEQSNDPTDPSA